MASRENVNGSVCALSDHQRIGLTNNSTTNGHARRLATTAHAIVRRRTFATRNATSDGKPARWATQTNGAAISEYSQKWAYFIVSSNDASRDAMSRYSSPSPTSRSDDRAPSVSSSTAYATANQRGEARRDTATVYVIEIRAEPRGVATISSSLQDQPLLL